MRAKKRFKRVLALLLTVALALGNVNVTATSVQAAEAEPAAQSTSTGVEDLPKYSGTPVTPTIISAANYESFNFSPTTYQAYEGYYAITSADEMYGLAALVNGGTVNVNAVLINDINLATDLTKTTAAIDWTPIGDASYIYKGTFDGQGHRIYNMTVNGSAAYVGLFGCVDDGTTIRSVIIDASCSIKGESFVAGIVGVCKQATTGITIENCGNEGTITAQWNAAGIVGCSSPNQNTKESMLTIRNCYNTGTISGRRESAAFSGWIGTNTKLINCYSAGTVSGADSGKAFARYDTTGSYSFTNCYQLNTVGTQTGVTSFTADQKANGELCYLLNTDQNDIEWYQTLTGALANAYPVLFDAETVYKHDNDGTITYANRPQCKHPNVSENTEAAVAATCLKEGSKTYICADCGDTWTEVVLATGHHFNEMTGICSGCGLVNIKEPAKIDVDNYTTFDLTESEYTKYLGYYAITSAEELSVFSNLVALGNTTANAILTKDIDLTDEWTPIGNENTVYAGTFDGRGHSISNLKIDSENDKVGLFGYIAGGTQIRNVILDETCSIKGINYVGGIVGAIQESSTAVVIENCGNEGIVTASSTYAAAIVGCVAPGETADNVTLAITNCYNTGAVTAASKSAAIGSGLGAKTTTANCYNTGAVSGADSGFTFVNYAGTGTNVNSYQLDTVGTQTGVTSVTASQIENGALTYLLNGNQSTIAWYQTLKGDSKNTYPVLFDAQRVYQYEITAAIEEGKIYYSNDSTACTHPNREENIVTAVTCLEDGIMKYSCSDCGQEWTEVISAIGHQFDDVTGECSGCELVKEGEPEILDAENYLEYGFTPDTYEKYLGYYVITDARDMFAFSNLVYCGNTTAKAVVTQNIDLSQVTVDGEPKEWIPIGNETTVYAGIFNGQGHTISNLKIDSEEDKVGLFGYIDGGTEIRNVILDASCEIIGKSFVGGIVGALKKSSEPTVIENCGNEGYVEATTYAAAIVANVAPESVSNSDVVLKITNCYNTGEIKAKTNAAAIGARLSSSTTITNSYNIGTITGGNTGFEFANYVGIGVIENSYQLYADGKTPDERLAVKAITSAQAQSGELCYLLNNDADTITWYQSLAAEGDKYPVLFGTAQVYKHKALGDNDKYYYTNDADGCAHTNKKIINVFKADCVTAEITMYSCDVCGGEWEEITQEAYGHYYTEDTHECIRCGRVQVYDGTIKRPATVTEENYAKYGLSASEYEDYIGFYAVTTPAELFGYAKIVNSSNLAASAILVKDIVINHELIDEDGNVDRDEDVIEWTVLGENYYSAFAGTIDGRGHAISGLCLDGFSAASFIGYSAGCTVRNLGITDSYMWGETAASFAAYFSNGITVENCYSTAILGGSSCFGIIGRNTSTPKNITVRQAAFFGEISGSASTSLPITDTYRDYGAIIENCVYLRDEEDKTSYWHGQGYTAEECASGAAAYALNSGETEQISWYQTIGTDAFPVLDAAHATVYSTTSCRTGYANKANVVKEHHFADHICEACGMTEDVVPDAEDGYYEISTAEQFLSFANMVNTGKTFVNARLMADIDLDGVNWTPIGTSEHPYKGTFDGQSYRIKNFKLTVDGPYQALFGAVEAGTHIQRVVLDSSCEITVSSSIQNESMVAALVSRSVGKRGEIIIEQCVNEAAVTSTVSSILVSAFFGSNETSHCANEASALRIIIRNCHNAGKLTGTAVMIMAGNTQGYPLYENCLSTGEIVGTGVYFAMPATYISVENCYVLNDGATLSNVVAAQCTTEEMQSGKIAYQLNNGAGKDIFYQTLGTDDVPTMDASHKKVYAKGTASCAGDVKELSFSNAGPNEVVADAHDFASGNTCSVCGTYKEPQCIDGIYQISDYSELLWFADKANEYAKTNISAAKKLSAVLTKNIVANENLFDTNGGLAPREDPPMEWDMIEDFWGTLDGQGHTISGLYCDQYDSAFGYYLYGTLQNIGIIDSYFSGDYAATFAIAMESNAAVIKNCYSTAAVKGDFSKASIVYSYHKGVVENCYYAGKSIGIQIMYRGNMPVSNCYYITQSSEEVEDTKQNKFYGYAALASDFASGKIAYQMNKNAGTNIWYQKLGTEGDPLPSLLASSDSIVYAASDMTCDGTLLTENYANVQSDIMIPNHTWDETGICKVCNQEQQPKIINGVYQIGTYGELVWFAKQVNDGQIYLKGELTADIVANKNLLKEDGSLSTTAPTYTWEMMEKFYGTLDGKGHTISGLYLKRTNSYSNVSLCNELGGTLKNIGIVDSFFSGYYVSTFAEIDITEDASISNCYSTATLCSSYAAGGIAYSWGYSDGPEIENCYYAGKLDAENAYGIVYYQEVSHVKNCYYIDTYYAASKSQLGTPMSAADFASGKVAYLLNESKSAGTTWYQKISDASDVYPHMTAAKDSLVYAEYAHGSNEVKAYSNTVPEGHTEPYSNGAHDNHVSDTGECEICGAQTAVIITAEDITVNYGYDTAIELKPEITKAAETDITEARWYKVVRTKNGNILEAMTDAGAIVESLTVDTGEAIGEYQYVLSIKTNASEYETRKTITVVVDKNSLDKSVFSYTQPTDLSYNGNVKTAAVDWTKVLTGAGELTIKYKKDNKGALLDEVSEVGTYHVYAVVAEGATYKAAEIEVGSFTINYINAPTNILYNGAAKAASYVTGTKVVVSANGYTVSDSLTGTFAASYTLTSASAGTVTKTLYFKNSAGYTCKSVNVSATFIVQAATPPVVTPPVETPTPTPVTPVKALPKKNKVVTVGKAVYKVTVSSKTKGTVTFMKPTNKTQKSITVPNTVKINGYTFKVTAIAANACKANSKLTTVSIGTNVKTIGKNAFLNCKKLSNITIKTTKLTSKTIGKNAFKGIKSTATIKVPKAKLKAYTKLLRTKGVTKKSKIKK